MSRMQTFGRAAPQYDAHADFQHAQTERAFAAALAQWPSHLRIADIGCGTGRFAALAASQRPDWRIIGIDLAFGMCAAARARCSTVQADMTQLPLAPASCDAALSSLCLQWVDDLPAAFHEIARILRPGGQAIITSLGSGTLHELHTAAEQGDLPLSLLPMRRADAYRNALRASGLLGTVEEDVQIRYYPDLRALLDSMRRIGASYPTAQHRGLSGARRWTAMQAAYETLRVSGGLPATWKRLFITLRKPR